MSVLVNCFQRNHYVNPNQRRFSELLDQPTDASSSIQVSIKKEAPIVFTEKIMLQITDAMAPDSNLDEGIKVAHTGKAITAEEIVRHVRADKKSVELRFIVTLVRGIRQSEVDFAAQGNCFCAIMGLIQDPPPGRITSKFILLISVNIMLDKERTSGEKMRFLDECTSVIEYLGTIFVKYAGDDRSATLTHFNKISHYKPERPSKLFDDVNMCFCSNVYISDVMDVLDRKPKFKEKKKKVFKVWF
jgi:hypothetical protein